MTYPSSCTINKLSTRQKLRYKDSNIRRKYERVQLHEQWQSAWIDWVPEATDMR